MTTKTKAKAIRFVSATLDHQCVFRENVHIGCLHLNDRDGLWYVFTADAGAMIARYQTLDDAQKGASKWLPRKPTQFKEDGAP